MLFQTTAAHEELRAKIRSFAEEEIKPLAFLMDQNNEFPEEAVKKLGKLGWMGIPFPKEYGGAGLDALSYAIAVEELARVDGGAGVILSAHVSLGSWPIFAYGTEEQKKKYLIPLAKGEKIGAFGLTEPNAGSDAGGTETTALDKGDYYLLNGGKIFITNAPKADTYVVFAVTTPDIGTRGISAFIVEKGWKGFEFGDHYDKMGIRSSSTAELIFNDVKVPKENLLGKEGDGFKIAMSTLDGGRIGIAAQALGIAQGAFEQALSYSKERIQFGKPIAAQQSIAFKLADMATKLRCARFLLMQREHEHCCTPAEHRAERVCEEVVHIAHAASGEKLCQLNEERDAEARAERCVPFAKRLREQRQQKSQRDEKRDVEQHVEPDLQREALVRLAPGKEKMQIALPRGEFVRLAAQQRDEGRDRRPADEQHRADRLSPREAAALPAADGVANGQNKTTDERSGHGKAHAALQKIKKIGNKVVHELPPDLISQLVSPFAVLSSSMRALTSSRKASHASSFST